MSKPISRILTGIKPTADQVHIGNYLGAIKPLCDLSKAHPQAETFFMIANMHALTQLHDPQTLQTNTISFLKLYLALLKYNNVDMDRFFIFNHALIPAHAQLSRVLSCVTNMGFMERMHAYKDAMAKGKANEVSVGTFCYPILQAADVVLYDADIVPVGQDQRQHIEFSRDIAAKFNHTFGETFALPEVYIQESVAVVPGIDGRKISKSYNNFIGLLDDEKTIRKRIKQIATDTIPVADPKDPDTCNVYNIIKHFLTDDERDALAARYRAGGLSYATVKEYATDVLLGFILPIQAIYATISEEEIKTVIDRGTQYASTIALTKMDQVNTKVGFVL